MTDEIANTGGSGKNAMFSKVGKYTCEKYIIFQRKDEILNTGKQKKHLKGMPQMYTGSKQLQNLQKKEDDLENLR